MTAGSLIIGLGAGIACLGIARLIARSIARIEFAIDDAWGDVPFLHGEIGDARSSRAGSGKADAADIQGMVALHSEGGL